MAKSTTPATKTPRPRKPAPVIDPASLANLPAHYAMNEFEACAYIGMSVHTLRQWRFRNIGPVYSKIPVAVRYRKCDLDEFMAQSAIRPQA